MLYFVLAFKGRATHLLKRGVLHNKNRISGARFKTDYSGFKDKQKLKQGENTWQLSSNLSISNTVEMEEIEKKRKIKNKCF